MNNTTATVKCLTARTQDKLAGKTLQWAKYLPHKCEDLNSILLAQVKCWPWGHTLSSHRWIQKQLHIIINVNVSMVWFPGSPKLSPSWKENKETTQMTLLLGSRGKMARDLGLYNPALHPASVRALYSLWICGQLAKEAMPGWLLAALICTKFMSNSIDFSQNPGFNLEWQLKRTAISSNIFESLIICLFCFTRQGFSVQP